MTAQTINVDGIITHAPYIEPWLARHTGRDKLVFIVNNITILQSFWIAIYNNV